jgi:hypothetical protein
MNMEVSMLRISAYTDVTKREECASHFWTTLIGTPSMKWAVFEWISLV